MNKHQYNLFILDMDGTMVDSEHLWVRAETPFWERLGARWGEKEMKQFMGMRLLDVFSVMKQRYNIQTKKTAQELIDELTGELIKLFKKELKFKQGFEQFFNLIPKPATRAIASSSPRKVIEEVVDIMKIRDHISYIISGEEVARTKPAPDIFNKTAEDLGFTPKESIVVEDSVNGVKAGAASGALTLAVYDDKWYKRSDFENFTPYIYTSFSELLKDGRLIKKIFG